MTITQIAKNYFYHLHKHPELSNQEFETTKYIIEKLEQLGGYTLDTRTKTGLIATINPGCKTVIGIRADIDALPIEEKTDLEYASQNKGVMHACGHDFHTANLLALAHIIKDIPLNITIKLIFQANEETTPGGSRQLLDNGNLDDVTHFFGLHVDPTYKTGDVMVKEGPLFASIDDFSVTIIGEGGHISTPNLVKDPMPCAIAVVNELMNGINKRIDPMNQPLLGVSTFKCGDGAFNIINNEAYFCGTLRTHNNLSRQQSIAFFDLLVENMVKAYGLTSQIDWEFGEPALINDVNLVQSITPYLTKKMPNAIKPLSVATFGGEDFSNYASTKPSLFFLLGCHIVDADFHNDKFMVDVNAFEYGIELFTNIIHYFNDQKVI